MASAGLLAQLDGNDAKQAVQIGVLSSLRKYLDSCSSDFFHSSKDIDKLARLGINATYKGHLNSRHAASATTERHVTRLVAQLCGNNPVTVLSSKVSKLGDFKNLQGTSNPIKVVRDLYRYTASSLEYESVGTSHAYLHDVVQCPADANGNWIGDHLIMDIFDRSPELNYLYASAVIPPESLTGCKHLRGEYYDYQVRGNTLDFFPDGDVEGGYSQPADACELLKHHMLQRGELQISYTRVESFAAHHLLLFVRGSLPCSETRHFGSERNRYLAGPLTFFTGSPRFCIPSKLTTPLSASILAAGSLTVAQMFARARAICKQVGLPEDEDLLVGAVNYCYHNMAGFRQLADFEYPITRWYHGLTRSGPAVFIRLAFNPHFWSHTLQLRKVNPRHTALVIETTVRIMPASPNSSPSFSLNQLFQLADNFADAVFAGARERPPALRLYRLLVSTAIANFLVHLDYSKLPLSRIGLPDLPGLVFAPYWLLWHLFLFYCLTRAVRLLYSLLDTNLQRTARAITDPFPVAQRLLSNCEKLTIDTATIPLSLPNNGPTHHLPGRPEPSQAVRQIDCKDPGGIDKENPGAGDRPFSQCVLDHIARVDRQLREWYHVAPSSTCAATLLSRWGNIPADIEGRNVVALPDTAGHTVPDTEILALLRMRPTSLMVYLPDRRCASRFISHKDCDEYNLSVSHRGFTGFSGILRFTHETRRANRNIRLADPALLAALDGEEADNSQAPLEDGPRTDHEEQPHEDLPTDGEAARDQDPRPEGQLLPTPPPEAVPVPYGRLDHPATQSVPAAVTLEEPTGTNQQLERNYGRQRSTSSELTSQRSTNDCWIVAIADSLRITYEEAIEEASTTSELRKAIALDSRATQTQISEWARSKGYSIEIHELSTNTCRLIGAHKHSNRRVLLWDAPSPDHLTACTCASVDHAHIYDQVPIDMSNGRIRNFLGMIQTHHYGLVLPRAEHRTMLDGLRMKLKSDPPVLPAKACILLGRPGSGKSAGFKNRFINKLNDRNDTTTWVMAFHSSAIRDSTKAKFDELVTAPVDYGNCLVTPELAHTGVKCPDVLCIDELGKWKPGEAEFLIYHLNPKTLVLTGDPVQGRNNIKDLTEEVRTAANYLDVVKGKCTVYLNYSYRLPRNYTSFYGFPCYAPPAPLPRRVRYAQPGMPVLAANNETVGSYLNANHKSMTFNSSQGWDSSERYAVIFNHASTLASDGDVYSAITRSSAGFDYIVNAASDLQGSEEQQAINDSAMLLKRCSPHKIVRGLLLQDNQLFRSNLQRHENAVLPVHLRNPFDPRSEVAYGARPPPKIATDTVLSEEYLVPTDITVNRRLQYLQKLDPAFIALEHFEPHEDLKCYDDLQTRELTDDLKDSAHQGSLDRSISDQIELDGLCIDYFGCPPDKFDREMMTRGQLTNQVDDSSITHSLFIRHNVKQDPTVTKLGMDTRIAPRTTDPTDDLIRYKYGADCMISKFHSLTGSTSKPLDEALLNDRRLRAYENLVYKDPKLNLAKSFKTHLDTANSETFLLIKQQYVNKIGKIYSKAKAPQVLTEYVFRVALELGPIFMYILYEVQKDFEPHNIYLHPGHSDEQFVDYIKKNWDFSVESMEDDATCWDTNIGPACIQFAYYLFDYYNIPEEYKLMYMDFKDNMHVLLFAIKYMMASGGPDTLPMNTIWSAMIQEIRLDLPRLPPLPKEEPARSLAIAHYPRPPCRIHGGDDVSINSAVRFSEWWALYAWYFPQVFKTVRTYHPLCFGWRLYPEPHRDPETLLARTLYSIRTNRIKNNVTDLLATAQQLTSNACWEQLTSVEQDAATAALSLLNKARIRYHAALAGTNNATKAGAVRRYDLTDSTLFVHDL